MYTTKRIVSDLIDIDVANVKDEWITWADEQVKIATGKTFTEISVTDKRYDGSGSDELILDEYPITTVTKIEYLYQYQPTEVWVELNSQYWRLYTEFGIIKLTPDLSGLSDICEFEEGVQNFKLSYKYGYTSIPKIVEFLATLYVVQEYYISTTGENGAVSSEKIGDYSVSYDSKGSISVPDLVNSILKKIERSNIGYVII